MIRSFYEKVDASAIEKQYVAPIVSQGFTEGKLVLALTGAALTYFLEGYAGYSPSYAVNWRIIDKLQ